MGDGKTKSLWRGGLYLVRRRILPILLLLGGSWALGGFVLLAHSPSPAQAAFGFKSLTATFTAQGGVLGAQPAGSHPEAWSTTLAFNTTGPPGEELADGAVKDLHIILPPGLVGAPALLPQCSRADFIIASCSAATAVGTLSLNIDQAIYDSTLYLLEPLPGQAAALGLHAKNVPVTLDLSISHQPPYDLIASITNASQAAELLGTTLTLEGSPNGNAFLTLPPSCGAPLQTSFSATSWQAPAITVLGSVAEPQPVTACGALSYSPSLEVTPTTVATASPSGLDLTLSAPDQGIASPGGRANADTSSATLTLPPGLTLNPPVAAGLAACTPEELAAETPNSEPGQGCPEASRVGSAEVTTPLLNKPIAGSLYVAEPDDPATAAPGAENPFDTLLALYLVLRDPDRGVLLSLPIRIDADPDSGRLTASFAQIPQLPLEHLELHFNSGPLAPLTTPAACGSHPIAYSLTPSSGNAPLQGSDPFTTSAADCNPRFAPSFSAGTSSNAAGRSAPFVLDLSQDAAEPNLSSFSLTLPPGLSADLAQVSTCPETATATASCPPDSRLGYARTALGSGPEPLWVPSGTEPESDVYLAGPYKGAPYSLVIAIPATAGPYDFGTVITRAALSIDPNTAQATVDLDPLPQIFHGIPLHYRTIHLVLDRPGLIRNPTSCEPTRITGTATAADGSGAEISSRFQAADCAALSFKPKLSLSLSGTSHRGAHPGVRVTLRPRPGDANMSGATVTLPPTELLDNRHVKAVCPADSFALGHCPKGALVGRAEVWTALLGRPLEGNIYLLAGAGRLPMLATSLDGEVHTTFVAKADSVHRRLRFHLAGIPDVPLEKVTLDLFGGKRGLIVDSGGVCSGTPRVNAFFTAQNGRTDVVRPQVASRCASARRRGH
jgi:hypothetical protein